MRSVWLLTLLCVTWPGCGPDGQAPNGRGTALRLADVPPGVSLTVPAQRRQWQYPQGVGQVITTSHYRIFTSADNPILMGHLPGFLEAAYANYIDLTHLAPGARGASMDVYMLASRQQWVHLTTHVFGAKAPHLAIGAGGYCYRGIGVYWDLRNRATLSVAAHEGLHQFLHHTMTHRLPLSIEEGLGVAAEGFHIRQDESTVVFLPRHNPSRYGTLRKALVNNRWIPAAKLLTMNAGDALKGMTGDTLAWYSQVWALSMFLRTSAEYRDGFFRMLADGQAGKSHLAMNVPADAYARLMKRGGIYSRTVAEPLFKHYITADMDTFERRYLAFARDLAALSDQASR